MSGVKMVEDERFRDDDGKLDLDKIKRYEDSSYKVSLLLKYIDKQQAITLRLNQENENLRKQVKSSETTSNATSNYNAFLESKITTLEAENENLQKELDNFKPVIFQDMQNGTVILYFKGDD